MKKCKRNKTYLAAAFPVFAAIAALFGGQSCCLAETEGAEASLNGGYTAVILLVTLASVLLCFIMTATLRSFIKKRMLLETENERINSELTQTMAAQAENTEYKDMKLREIIINADILKYLQMPTAEDAEQAELSSTVEAAAEETAVSSGEAEVAVTAVAEAETVAEAEAVEETIEVKETAAVAEAMPKVSLCDIEAVGTAALLDEVMQAGAVAITDKAALMQLNNDGVTEANSAVISVLSLVKLGLVFTKDSTITVAELTKQGIISDRVKYLFVKASGSFDDIPERLAAQIDCYSITIQAYIQLTRMGFKVNAVQIVYGLNDEKAGGIL